MKTKLIRVGILVFAIGIVGGVLLNRQSTDNKAKPAPAPEPPVVAVVKPAPPAPPPEPTPMPEVSAAPDRPVTSSPAPERPRQNPNQNQTQKPAREPLHDPAARDALALVGVDPNAENYWLDAIFDTSLPDKERDDLMEDLNEVGFADPQNPTAADLPLIANRLDMIEEILPNADDFMTAHLMEAYKDLANMYDKAASR